MGVAIRFKGLVAVVLVALVSAAAASEVPLPLAEIKDAIRGRLESRGITHFLNIGTSARGDVFAFLFVTTEDPDLPVPTNAFLGDLVADLRSSVLSRYRRGLDFSSGSLFQYLYLRVDTENDPGEALFHQLSRGLLTRLTSRWEWTRHLMVERTGTAKARVDLVVFGIGMTDEQAAAHQAALRARLPDLAAASCRSLALDPTSTVRVIPYIAGSPTHSAAPLRPSDSQPAPTPTPAVTREPVTPPPTPTPEIVREPVTQSPTPTVVAAPSLMPTMVAAPTPAPAAAPATPSPAPTVVAASPTPRPPGHPSPAPAPIRRRPLGSGESTRVSMTVHFDFDKSEVKPSERSLIDDFWQGMAGRRIQKVLLKGHCDWVSSHAYNDALGLRRARNVGSYLHRTHGVPRARLQWQSFGKRAPKKSNETETGRAFNRRTEITVYLR